MEAFEDLFSELQHKAVTRPKGPRTVEELDHGVHFIGKKLVEEAAEAWMVCEYESDEVACEEVSQLLYHVQVMMLTKGYNPQDVHRYLQSSSPLTSLTRLPHHRSGTVILRIAIPNRGSLSNPVIIMLSEAGYRTHRTGCELVLVDETNGVELFFLRPCDIAVYAGQGTVHVGIAGRDLLLDSGVDAVEHLPLGFVRSIFCFATPKGTMSSLADVAGRCAATPYDALVRSYLATRGMDAQIVHLDGVVESSVQLGAAGLITDVVETGTTLRAAGLETFRDPILVSKAVLATTEQLRAESGLATLVWRLEGVLRARVYVLVDYDIPTNKLHLATSLTPGIEPPTVSPLQNPDQVAVRAMVLRADINRVMDEFYKVGAHAILISSLLVCRL